MMDIPSLLSTTVIVIKAVDRYASSIKDAARSCKSLSAKLASTQKLLINLKDLVEEESQTGSASNQDALLQLVDDKQLKRLQATSLIGTWQG